MASTATCTVGQAASCCCCACPIPNLHHSPILDGAGGEIQMSSDTTALATWLECPRAKLYLRYKLCAGCSILSLQVKRWRRSPPQDRSNPPSKRRSLRSPAASNESPTEIDAASQSSAHALTKCVCHIKTLSPTARATRCCSPRVPSLAISAFRSALYNKL